MERITENTIESFAIELLECLGYEYIHGPDITPDGDASTGSADRRDSYEQFLLMNRLERVVKRINPGIPAEAQAEAIKEIQRIHSSELLSNNETFHRS